MKNTNLLAALRAFKALADNLPRELPGDGYAAAVEQLDESFVKILSPMLETQYFLYGAAPEGDYAGIFDNAADRDAFISKMGKIIEERKGRGDTGEMVCKPITFEEFLDFAEGEMYDLDNYSLAEDGAIEFVPNFAEV